MDPIGEFSAEILQIQQASADKDLSGLIQKVQTQLDTILSNEKDPFFGQAVLLQFSLLESLKNRIGKKAYREKMEEKIKQIFEKTLPDKDEQAELQLYLGFLQDNLYTESAEELS